MNEKLIVILLILLLFVYGCVEVNDKMSNRTEMNIKENA